MTDTYIINAANGKATIVKSPNEVLDYTFDWSAYLADPADTLVGHEVVADTGLTLNSSQIITTAVSAFVQGGTVGTTYRLKCKVTTAGGRTAERSIYIKIAER